MKDHTKITKAVIAVAGYGTRFLPATKNQPKEMLPIIDKPIIHYLVDEAVQSGIKDIILVTRFGQHIMEDYFDSNLELEHKLEEDGKLDYLAQIREVATMANFIYVRQRKDLPYGNGTPLLCVKDLIDEDESFVYMWGDDLTLYNGYAPVTKQLIDVFEREHPTAVEGVQAVPWDEVSRYGIVKYKEDPSSKYELESLVEKPKKEDAPSNMVQFGRFVFSYEIIEKAQHTATGKGNELWVTDMINELAHEGKKIIAPPIKGEWLTTGDPLRYLKATFKFAMQREDLKKDLLEYLEKEICDQKGK
jgi:UTP--glucose-1-phosphate uridylyltransferase